MLQRSPRHTASEGPSSVPDELYASLVGALFANTATLYIAAFAASTGALLAAWSANEPVLATVAGLIIANFAFRLAVVHAFNAGPEEKTRKDLERWERLYVVGGSVHQGLLGLLGYLALAVTTDDFARILSITLCIAYLMGVIGRNFANRRLARVQIFFALAPISVGLLQLGGLYPTIIVTVIVPFVVVADTIVARLRTTLLDSVIRAHEITRLNERMNAALTNMPHGLVMLGADRKVRLANDQFGAILGLPTRRLEPGLEIGRIDDMCRGFGCSARAGGPTIADALWWDYSGELETQDGRTLSFDAETVKDGGRVVVVQDVTERVEAEKKIARLAAFDVLTDLPNRITLVERIHERGLRKASFSALFIDLDQFKQINDTLGHRRGDLLLREVADRLRRLDCAGEPFRFGGDEFVLLVAGGEAEAAAAAEEAIRVLSAPYQLEMHQIVIGASVGVVLQDDTCEDADQILRMADTALYAAKAAGRGCWKQFHTDMSAKAARRLSLEMDLRKAVENEDLRLVYQPLFDLKMGRYRACEALLRWTRPGSGPVSPAEFIPIAEETGLIVPIGRWVLLEACRTACIWPDDVRLAVNLSPVQFDLDDVVAAVEEAIRTTGFPASRLEVEITETVLMREGARIRKVLHKLNELGIGICLDDFGTGYSSLAYLQAFRFDKLKIDRSFLAEIETNATARRLLRRMAQIGSDLGMRVTVEGVETKQQLDIVAAVRAIDEIQGYYFSRPVAADELHFPAGDRQSDADRQTPRTRSALSRDAGTSAAW